MHISQECLWIYVEGWLGFVDKKVSLFIFQQLIKNSERYVDVGGVVVGVEEAPAVGHIAVDVLAAVEKSIILNWANVGVHTPTHVPSIGVIPEVALIEEVKGEDIIFFVFRKYFFLLLIVNHIEAQASTNIVRERDCHRVIMIEQHPWRLLMPVL